MPEATDTSLPSGWQTCHDGRLVAMIEAAMAAGDQTLRYYRQAGLEVEAKEDDSPVTIADKSAERLVRQMVAERFPNDALEGEEFDDTSGTSRYGWIVDPIDGTKSFVCGVPLYSTLLALLFDGEPVGGLIHIPALGETVVAATGLGAWYRERRTSPWQATRVSNTHELSSAVLLTSQTDLFDRRSVRDRFESLERSCRVSRTWGDGYGYLLVATGRADVMVDAVCNPWDIAAMLPILAEAGGRFTDWKGIATCRGGEGLGTNGRLHDRVIAFLGR